MSRGPLTLGILTVGVVLFVGKVLVWGNEGFEGTDAANVNVVKRSIGAVCLTIGSCWDVG